MGRDAWNGLLTFGRNSMFDHKSTAPRAEMVADLSRLMSDLIALKFQNDSIRTQKELPSIMIKGTKNEELDIKLFTTVSKYIRDTERFL